MSLAARTFASLRAPAQPPIDKDAVYLAVAFARLAMTEDGKLLRAWLHQKYVLARLPAEASDSALRMAEGARQVPADFEAMVKRGERELSGPK
jgi:hypothetical protein